MKLSNLMTLSGASAAMTAFMTVPALAQESGKVGKPTEGAYGFQDGVTPISDSVDKVHTIVLWMMVAIVIFVLALMIWVMVRYNAKANPNPSKTSHNTLIEIIWTAVPVVLLFILAIFAVPLLMLTDKTPEADLTVKATGYQWYWDITYPDYDDLTLTSVMLSKEEAAAQGKPYLLGTDNAMVVPAGATVKVLTAGADVIHSWTVPAFAVKVDAIPGRINETWFRVEEEDIGVYYGQCSELCGKDHAYMPIEVRVVSQADFDAWMADQQEQLASFDALDGAQFAEAN